MRLLSAAICVAFASTLSAGIGEDIELLGSDAASATEKSDALERVLDKELEAFDKLVEGLANEKPAVQSVCARLLGSLGDTRAVPSLTLLLKPAEGGAQADVTVKLAAIDALSKLARESNREDIGEALLEALQASELSDQERYALASALADIVFADADDVMEGYLKRDASDPALASCAVRFFAKRDRSSAWEQIVEFCDAKKTEGEGENAKEVWAFSDDWKPIKQLAVFELVQAGRSEGLRLLIEQVEEGVRFEDVVIEDFAQASSRYGRDLVNRLIEILKDKNKSRAHNFSYQLLAKLGDDAVRAVTSLAREGLEVVAKAEEEGKTEADPYKGTVGRALSELVKERAGRLAMLDVYRGLDSDEGELRERFFNTLVASNTPEARVAILDGLKSNNVEWVESSLDSWARNLDGRDLEAMAPLASHEQAEVRTKFAETLSRSRFPLRVRDMLIRLSRDENVDVRAAAWVGIGKGDDEALIDEFERAFGDDSDEVQQAAAKAFDDLIKNLKPDYKDKDKRKLRRRLITLLETTLAANEGAALGITEDFSSYYNALFNQHQDDGLELVAAIRNQIKAEDGKARAYAARSYNGRFWDKDWTSDLVDALKDESDATAAEAQLGALASRKYRDLDQDDKESLVPLAIKWLSVGENPDDSANIPARQAAKLLGELGGTDSGKGGLYTEVYEPLKRAVTNAIAASMPNQHSAEDATTVTYGIEAFTTMKASGLTSLVIEALAKVKHKDLNNKARAYLSAHATESDLPAIDGISSLSKSHKDKIRRDVERRSN